MIPPVAFVGRQGVVMAVLPRTPRSSKDTCDSPEAGIDAMVLSRRCAEANEMGTIAAAATSCATRRARVIHVIVIA